MPETMPPESALVVEVRAQTLRVTLNRPEKRNALSRDVLAALRQVFTSHAADSSLRLALITAAGDKSFAAGGDLKDLDAIRDRAAAEVFAREACAALDAVRRFPVPVIAALNGTALGGGAELALSCDLRIAAAHAKIGFVQGRLNIPTAWGGGSDLMRLLGYGRGLEVLARAEVMDARTARELGLFNAVAAEGADFGGFAEEYVAAIAWQAPQVMRALKASALAERDGLPLAERRKIDVALFIDAWLHPDHWDAAGKILSK
jgi:enoyl-CoA hydratase